MGISRWSTSATNYTGVGILEGSKRVYVAHHLHSTSQGFIPLLTNCIWCITFLQPLPVMWGSVASVAQVASSRSSGVEAYAAGRSPLWVMKRSL